jgi:hypothetical protein
MSIKGKRYNEQAALALKCALAVSEHGGVVNSEKFWHQLERNSQESRASMRRLWAMAQAYLPGACEHLNAH